MFGVSYDSLSSPLFRPYLYNSYKFYIPIGLKKNIMLRFLYCRLKKILNMVE